MLHLHPNTVGQRLSRIGTALGADWSEPARAWQIQSAVQLRAVFSPHPTQAQNGVGMCRSDSFGSR